MFVVRRLFPFVFMHRIKPFHSFRHKPRKSSTFFSFSFCTKRNPSGRSCRIRVVFLFIKTPAILSHGIHDVCSVTKFEININYSTCFPSIPYRKKYFISGFYQIFTTFHILLSVYSIDLLFSYAKTFYKLSSESLNLLQINSQST